MAIVAPAFTYSPSLTRIFPISPADLLERVSDELAVIRPDFSITLDPLKSESFCVLKRKGDFSETAHERESAELFVPQLERVS